MGVILVLCSLLCVPPERKLNLGQIIYFIFSSTKANCGIRCPKIFVTLNLKCCFI